MKEALSIQSNEANRVNSDERVVRALNTRQLQLVKGEFVAVGVVDRCIRLAQALSKRGLITQLTLIDRDPRVLNYNSTAASKLHLSFPITIVSGYIETYSPSRTPVAVDWSNAPLWKSFRRFNITDVLERSRLHLVSDFIDGPLWSAIEQNEPVEIFRSAPGDLAYDFLQEPRSPETIPHFSSLHSLATTIKPSKLVPNFYPRV